MAEVLVCNSNWNGVKNETFKWHNPDRSNNVTFTQNGTNPWPFTLSSPFTVNAGSKLDCGLIGQAGTYTYNSGPCPSAGNPKTVIIS
jgi:hypothetical protein